MQNILDDMQNDITNELEKVSLERLAEINPDLLSKIKKAAQESLRPENSLFSGSNEANTKDLSMNDWSMVVLDVSGIAQSLRSLAVRHTEDVYTQTDALQMIKYLAASQVVLQQLEKANASSVGLEEEYAKSAKKFSSASRIVDPSTFTNEGIKIHNDAMIALLYEIGLPYVSQADARRFRTQLELSHHLDALFRKKQVAKIMVATQERGWYASDLVWCKDSTNEPLPVSQTSQNDTMPGTNADGAVDTSTYLVDESRDHCVVCGNLFKMVMDHDADEYVYENCREITVINDDAAATESSEQLVHVTCWKGLGSPPELTFDQTVVQDVSERYL
jgi:pre-mRNA cleavage complex 2 protein Pcf11